MPNQPQILLIIPENHKTLQQRLKKDYDFQVTAISDPAQVPIFFEQQTPDLILQHYDLIESPFWEHLDYLQTQEMTIPMIVIGPSDKKANFSGNVVNYTNIKGWINAPFSPSELASLISTTLSHPPQDDWVLIKREEAIKATQLQTQRAQEFDILLEVGKSVTSSLNVEAVLALVVEAAVTLTNAEESYLLLVEKGSGNLYLRAEANLEESHVQDFRIRVDDSISGQVVQSGKPIILSRNSNTLKIKTGLTVYSLVNAPLIVGDTVIGVLGINNRHIKQAFTHHHQELLSALGDWAAIAIQNARLYAATKDHNRDLAMINHITRLISGTLDIEQIPRLLIQRTTEIFKAECGSLALIDHDQGVVVFQAAYDRNGNDVKSMKDFLMPLGQGIIGKVAQTGKPYLVNSTADDPSWSPVVDRLTGFTTKKVLAVPLVVEGEVLGVVELLNKDEGDFTQDDLRLLSLVASSAAISLKNAQQYAALKAANEALQQAQAQRIASERWTVLGQAAGNLAHRINNSTALVPIAAQHLQELLEDITMPPETRQEVDENLDRIYRNTLYTVELAMALLKRFRKIPSQAHDINALIEAALSLVELPDHIKIVTHLDPDLPEVDTSDLMTDIFVELITNAKKVMADEDGLLHIASFKIGQDISIQITDSGPGISPEDQDRIFDMFYTTNPDGLGFGLWWVKTFLEQQHGQITVESEPGKGTTFTITLPAGR